MSKFDEYINAVVSGSEELAKDIFGSAVADAKSDSESFLNEMKNDIERYVSELADGKISKDMFESLMQDKKDLLQLHALTQAGIATVKLEKFRLGFISLLSDKAFEIFL